MRLYWWCQYHNLLYNIRNSDGSMDDWTPPAALGRLFAVGPAGNPSVAATASGGRPAARRTGFVGRQLGSILSGVAMSRVPTPVFASPFREEAVASRNRRQQLDRLLRITAPHERVVLAGIGLVLLAFVAWALFGSVERSVRADGVLIEPGARHEVVSTDSGYIVEYLVSAGDRIGAGIPIARQSVPELQREIAALRDRVALLETETGQAGGRGDALRSLLASARVALVQMEARRSARELVVSQIEGEVMALHAAPGDYLPAGAAVAQLRDTGDHPLRAVLGVAPRIAQRIRPGLRASVEVVTRRGRLGHRRSGAGLARGTSSPGCGRRASSRGRSA